MWVAPWLALLKTLRQEHSPKQVCFFKTCSLLSFSSLLSCLLPSLSLSFFPLNSTSKRPPISKANHRNTRTPRQVFYADRRRLLFFFFFSVLRRSFRDIGFVASPLQILLPGFIAACSVGDGRQMRRQDQKLSVGVCHR